MLNEGNFGRVGKALDTKTNTHVAIKFIERGPRLVRLKSDPQHWLKANMSFYLRPQKCNTG